MNRRLFKRKVFLKRDDIDFTEVGSRYKRDFDKREFAFEWDIFFGTVPLIER